MGTVRNTIIVVDSDATTDVSRGTSDAHLVETIDVLPTCLDVRQCGSMIGEW